MQTQHAALQPWRAQLDLGFTAIEHTTRLTQRAHVGPLRVQRPLYPEGPSCCHVLVIHPPGGVAGGDELHLKAHVGPGAHAWLSTPGAAKWYKSMNRWASQDVQWRVSPGARLEWLPQESIVFDDAQADMRTRIDLEGDARYCGWDIMCLGRQAAGERFSRGQLRLGTELLRDGRLLWQERGRIAGDSAWLQDASGLGGDPVWGTLVCAAGEVKSEWLQTARDHAEAALSKGVRLSATAMPGVLLVRALGTGAEAVRQTLQLCWHALRPQVMGCDAHDPRIWAT